MNTNPETALEIVDIIASFEEKLAAGRVPHVPRRRSPTESVLRAVAAHFASRGYHVLVNGHLMDAVEVVLHRPVGGRCSEIALPAAG